MIRQVFDLWFLVPTWLRFTLCTASALALPITGQPRYIGLMVLFSSLELTPNVGVVRASLLILVCSAWSIMEWNAQWWHW